MISQRLYGMCFAVVLMLAPFGTVHAISLHLEFTASGFALGSSEGTTAPLDPVSGSIFYTAASITSDIENITGIDLTIGNHSYSVGEVLAETSGGSLVFQCIATSCSFGPSGRNFVIEWRQDDPFNPAWRQFGYSVAAEDGYPVADDFWSTTSFDNFTITAVPVPPAVLLFGSGLLGLIGAARRRRSS